MQIPDNRIFDDTKNGVRVISQTVGNNSFLRIEIYGRKEFISTNLKFENGDLKDSKKGFQVRKISEVFTRAGPEGG